MAKKLYPAVLEWLDYLREQQYKEHTVVVYGRELKKMYEYYGAYQQLDSVTTERIRLFLKSDPLLKGVKDQPLARNTIDRTIRVFRLFLNWAAATELINANPWPTENSNGL